MDPKHLLYLSVVLEKGSLTEAAKHLNVTQPTLTRVMATLEMQAGGQLFSRSRYGVKGTEVGEELAREGRSIQQNIEQAKSAASRHRIGMAREIKIGIGPLISATLMPPVIDRLMLKYPQQSISLAVYSPVDLINQLLDNQLDFMIAPAPAERIIAGTNRRLLSGDTLGVYAGREHPLAAKRNISIDDFEHADWVSLGHANPFERQVMDLLNNRGIANIRTQLVFRNEGAMLLELLAQGKHLAVLADLPMRAAVEAERFVRLDFNTDQATHRDIYFWSQDKFEDREFEESFYKMVKTHFQQYG